MANKTVISIEKPTPKWATWVFRIVFLLTTAATFIIGSDPGIPAEIAVRIGVYLKAADLVVWSLSRMVGIQEEKPKWGQK
ncbi:hypothetical protein [Chitinophaga lutea]|uniref:hypothetical protein n=1 Tax=Chitinophaga lutea TaxID=2488634 RepID=UPI000F4E5DE6|nr:hypothetical protein [Chitinophaga lutea]